MTETRVTPGGTIKWVKDDTTNDSEKTFTVPAGKRWDVLSVYAEITCTATAGNRVLNAAFTTGATRILTGPKSAAITANQKGTYLVNDGALVGTDVNNLPLLDTSTPNIAVYAGTFPAGGMRLLAGYTIIVGDLTGVAAVADDLTVVLQYIEYDA